MREGNKMIKLKKIGDAYNLCGSREDLLSLTKEALEEIIKLTDEVAAAEDVEEKQKNTPYLKFVTVPKETALKPWLN